MKSSLKKVSLFVALILIITAVFTGCGKKPNDSKSPTETDKTDAGKPDISKEVKLKMYLLGDKSEDFDLVFGEINKLLKEDINATVDVNFLSWGDYEQRYPLLFASGEDFDVIYTADWAFYNAQASKGGFMEITEDMLTKYAPKTKDTMYKDAWEQAKVNGKVYMLPMNYKELTGYVFLVRGDLTEKYGIADIKSLEDYEKYLDVVAKNEKQLVPIDVGSDFDMTFMFDRVWQSLTDVQKVGPWQLAGWTENDDKDYNIKHQTENDKFLETVTKLK